MKVVKSETNNAVVTRLTNVRKHINADKMLMATVCGDTVIVGLDAKDGDMVVYFDCNLCISKEFLKENNLFNKKELNKDIEKGGYFNSKGVVKPTNLRGEKSYGFTTSLESIAEFTGVSIEDLKEDLEFNDINGINVCNKYVAVQSGKSMSGSKKAKAKMGSVMFKEHWDTKKFAKNIKFIPEDRMIYIEEKEHGTSQRSGFSRCKRELSWYEKLLSKVGVKIYDGFWQPLNGTRRTNITRDVSNKSEKKVRDIVFDKIKPNLKKGETVFYELSGYDTNGSWIQKGYPYGCEVGECRDILYRVTMNSIEGDSVDMGREYVYKRAEELGMNKPHLFEKYHYKGDVDELIKVVNSHTDGRSMAGEDTLREGVVVWFEGFDGQWTCLKNKSFDFLMADTKAKEKKDYVDMEELEG